MKLIEKKEAFTTFD